MSNHAAGSAVAVAHSRPQSQDAPDPSDYERMPSSIETEQALLGAMLVNNEAYYQAVTHIGAEHFYEPLHGKIFETVGKLIEKGRIATPLTVHALLESDPVLREIGGASYLANLAAAASNTFHVSDYAQTLFDLAVRRGLIQIGEELVARARDADIDDDPSAQIVDAEQVLYEIAEKGKYREGSLDFSRALEVALTRAEAAFKRDSALAGMPTGFADLDRRLGGLQRSDLVILAGRPAMGKSALATNMAFNIAKEFRAGRDQAGKEVVEAGGRVLFFSLEMSADQLATRILAEQAAVPSHKIRDGTISRQEFGRLADAVNEIQHVPLFIDDTGGLSISAISARARRLARKPGIDLIIIDYVQLLTGSGRKRTDNRVQEMTEITTSLKALAKELNVPIIGLSQLSRAVESRDDKRPQLADLRESGSIEQDADIVMFIFREEYYHEQKKPTELPPDAPQGASADMQKVMQSYEQAMQVWEEKKMLIQNLAEVIVAKHRHGAPGTVKLHFDPEITRFHNYASTDRAPRPQDGF